MWADFFFLSTRRGRIVLDTLESVDGGVRKAREERVAIVNAGQNERDNEFKKAWFMVHCIRFLIDYIYLSASLVIIATNEKKRLIIIHAHYTILLLLT